MESKPKRTVFISAEEPEGGIAPAALERYPSSIATSYRSASVASGQGQPKNRWSNVRKSLVNGTLVAVGLRPTREEGRHWDAVKANVLSSISEEPQGSSITMQTSHRPKDRPLLRHLSRHGFTSILPPLSSEEVDMGVSSPLSLHSQSGSMPKRMASIHSYRVDRSTGRNQAVPSDLKPDLWKLAVNSIRASSMLSRKKSVDEVAQRQLGEGRQERRSFDFLDDDDDDDEEEEQRRRMKEEMEKSLYPLSSAISPGLGFATVMEVEEDDFFGDDHAPETVVEETDSATVRAKPSTVRREKIQEVKKFVDKVTLSGGYVGGGGGLGAITRLLNFKYAKLRPEVQKELDNKLLHKRPYFTYWLMVVHVIIMIIALAVYGFAPYGWDLIEDRATVRQTDLSFATVSRLLVPSVWGGPPQQALVLLGAIFAPCMRRDRQLFEGIESDRQAESNFSGCCVRRDMSGCFQAESQMDCQPRFSDFIFESNDTTNTRGVCGTSPKTCTDPAPGISSGDVWVPDDILTWPICREDTNANASDPHLTCEVTSAPCCFGIQANCMITTREQCNFLKGRFRQEAFLCSQVDCLNDICGLLPFREFNQPDQIYRLWIALFLHAGLIHLALILIFSFFVLRHVEKRLGWWRTAVIYIFSGIGGNLVSAYLAPYNPEVGPAGSVAGVIAYFFVFLIFESPLLKQPWKEALKLAGVSAALFLLGLIPYVDNYAHIGGFVFGFFISGILVPYGNFKEVRKLTNKSDGKDIDRIFLTVKVVMIFVGLVAVLGLFALFLVLLYVVQDTWVGFSYLTCIPFTSTLCIDQQVVIRDRDMLIV